MTLHGQEQGRARCATALATHRHPLPGDRATCAINLKDFGIEVPSYFGVTVQPDIDASATFTAEHP